MRTLSSTLLTAQQSGSHPPYVKLEVRDRVAGITRLNWARLYSGNDPDFYHAVAMPCDGSLVRARVDPSGYQLYRQHIVSPGPGSDFSPWTGVCTVSSASGIALSSRGFRVLLFYVNSDQKTLLVRESTDYGASFGSATAITTAATAIGWLAADINGSDTACLFYSGGGTVYAVKRTSGTWGPPSAWTNSAAAITGIGCCHQGDWNLVICGQDSAGKNKVWTCVYGDGYSQSPGTWSGLAELTVASPGSNVEFRCPYVNFSDVFHIFFVEKYSGTASYTRPYWSHSLATADYISNLWREPVPFNSTSNYGLALVHSGSYAWLSAPSGVWRAALLSPSLDITNDVIALNAQTLSASGKMQIDLRNDDGRYSDIGLPSSAFPSLKLGSEVLFSPGYRTSIGNEASGGPAYWIEGWTHLSTPPSPVFRLYASDAWGLLESWKARRQFAWAAGSVNIFQLLNFILARAGLEFSSLSYSAALVNLYPAFTINPGESGRSAVLHLLSQVPDVLFFRGNCGYVINPQDSDSSVYAYGTTHVVLEGEYSRQVTQTNRVQVFGSGVFTEDWDWEGIDLVYDRLNQVHDINLDTEAEAHDRGEAILRHAGIESQGGYILVPMNCGQELHDVVDITDACAGLVAAKRRVHSLVYTYDTRRGVYTLKIGLGGV